MPPSSARPAKAKEKGGFRRLIIAVMLCLVIATLAANLVFLNPGSNAVDRVRQDTADITQTHETKQPEVQPSRNPGATIAEPGVRRAGTACDVDIPELEPSWSRYFAEEGRGHVPSCGEPAQLASLETRPDGAVDVVENPGACAGALVLSFVDPTSSNWTSVLVHGRAALLADSAILQCLRDEEEAPRPGAPTQLILHPLVDRAVLSRAQVLSALCIH
jgi:hypothetical protein